MIKTAIVAMTVLGCDCDAKMCQFVSQTPAQWASIEKCEASSKARIVRNSDLNYPLVSVECRLVREAPEIVQASATAVEAPIAVDNMQTAAMQEQPQGWGSAVYGAASSRSRMIYRKTAGGYEYLSSGFGSATSGALGLARKSVRFVGLGE